MPIYEYRCHDCHRRVSRFYRSFTEIEEVPSCPRCGGLNLTRLISEGGEDMPEEFGEVIDRLESGQSPEDIESAMPELADDMGGMGGGMDDLM